MKLIIETLNIISVILFTIGVIFSLFFFFEERFIYGILVIFSAVFIQLIRIFIDFKFVSTRKAE